MSIFIEKLELKKIGSNLSIEIDINLSFEDIEKTVSIKYLSKKSSVDYFISNEDKELVFCYFLEEYNIQNLDIFNPICKLNNKNFVIKNEMRFIDLFKISTKILPLSYLKILFDRVQVVSLFNEKKKMSIKDSSLNLKKFNFKIKKKNKITSYELEMDYSDNFYFKISSEKNILLEMDSFDFNSFKYFLKSHFGVILASKEKGFLNISKNNVYRNMVNINLIDRLETEDFITNNYFYAKDLFDDIINIFDSIIEIHNFLLNNKFIYNKGLVIEKDCFLDDF